MSNTLVNMVQATISNTPSTSGNFTISSAVPNYLTLGASNDGQTYGAVLIQDTSIPGFEVRNGCVYTNSTTTLTRGTLESSSSGSAINFTSAATISIVLSAGQLQAIINSIPTASIDYVNYSFAGGV